MCMYVSEICAEGIFVTFPCWLENVKSRSKIGLFSNKRHFEIWFPKKRIITFFSSKLSKLYKKDPILHVATLFSLKQGETRTSHGPIPHPLRKVRLNTSFCGVENVESRSKIALFSSERHLEIWFPRKRTLRFSEVNYLNYTKKTQFCMWQLHFP